VQHREISVMKHSEPPANPAVQHHEYPEEDDQLKDGSDRVIEEEELIKGQQRQSHSGGQWNGF